MLVSIVNVQFFIDPSQAIIQLKKYQTPMFSFVLLDLSYVWLRVVTKYPVTSILIFLFAFTSFLPELHTNPNAVR